MRSNLTSLKQLGYHVLTDFTFVPSELCSTPALHLCPPVHTPALIGALLTQATPTGGLTPPTSFTHTFHVNGHSLQGAVPQRGQTPPIYCDTVQTTLEVMTSDLSREVKDIAELSDSAHTDVLSRQRAQSVEKMENYCLDLIERIFLKNVLIRSSFSYQVIKLFSRNQTAKITEKDIRHLM